MRSLSRIDLFFLLKELKVLEGAKVSKISQPSKREFFIDFHVRNEGKKTLRLGPDGVFLSSEKPASPVNPFHFCSVLRLRLNNAILKEVSQPGFERLFEFVFSSKKGVFRLFVELFGKGNIIFTDEDCSIILALEAQSWSSREIKFNRVYRLPPAKVDLLSLSSDDVYSLITSSSSSSLVKALAIELGLGGGFAEEICSKLGVDKVSSVKISKSQSSSIKKHIEGVLKSKISPFVHSNEPYPLLLNSIPVSSKFSSFSSAIESVFFLKPVKESAQVVKIRRIIESQEKMISELSLSSEELLSAGEKIYSNYELIDGILSDIRKFKDKKKLMEKYPIISGFDSKGNIILEF